MSTARVLVPCGLDDGWTRSADQPVPSRPRLVSVARLDVQKNPLLPKSVVQMVSAGEESGKLGEVLDEVSTFYTKQLSQADWTMSATSTANGDFAATFSRKSDSHVTGTLAANRDANTTKILVSLVSTG